MRALDCCWRRTSRFLAHREVERRRDPDEEDHDKEQCHDRLDERKPPLSHERDNGAFRGAGVPVITVHQPSIYKRGFLLERGHDPRGSASGLGHQAICVEHTIDAAKLGDGPFQQPGV